eukprot:365813-Chlamydomonas_euryale.AAC.13
MEPDQGWPFIDACMQSTCRMARPERRTAHCRYYWWPCSLLRDTHADQHECKPLVPARQQRQSRFGMRFVPVCACRSGRACRFASSSTDKVLPWTVAADSGAAALAGSSCACAWDQLRRPVT